MGILCVYVCVKKKKKLSAEYTHNQDEESTPATILSAVTHAQGDHQKNISNVFWFF